MGGGGERREKAREREGGHGGHNLRFHRETNRKQEVKGNRGIKRNRGRKRESERGREKERK